MKLSYIEKVLYMNCNQQLKKLRKQQAEEKKINGFFETGFTLFILFL